MTRSSHEFGAVARPSPIAPVAGLAIAWGGTALLVSPAARVFGDSNSITAALLGQAAFWLLLAIVLGIVRVWEREPLSSLWLKPWPYAAGMEQALVLPLWMRVLAVIGAGVIEETLFKGYAVT